MWALNHVITKATGQPILNDRRGNYALSTISVAQALAIDSRRFQEIKLTQVRAGDIAIAATRYQAGKVAHRGHGYIVGRKKSVGSAPGLA